MIAVTQSKVNKAGTPKVFLKDMLPLSKSELESASRRWAEQFGVEGESEGGKVRVPGGEQHASLSSGVKEAQCLG